MHATAPAMLAFTKSYGSASNVYRTTAIAGVAGSSGGALCVQYDDGHYFPAAVYVGGNGETIFRAIDQQVDDLIQRADISSRGGDNNTSGGIVQVSSRRSVASFTIAELKVNLGPASAIAAGAKWQVKAAGSSNTPRAQRGSGEIENLASGSYTISFSKVEGFARPPSRQLEIDSNDQVVVTGTYATITSTSLADAIATSPYSSKVIATGNPRGFSAPALSALNLSIDAQGQISGTVKDGSAGAYPIEVSALYDDNEKVTKTFTLLVREPRVLFLAYDKTQGSVTGGKPAVKQGRNTVGRNQQQILTAKPKTPDYLFGGWKVAGDTPTTQNGATISFAIDGDQALTIEATFIENPFKPLAGKFAGRVSGAIPSFEHSGTFMLKLTNSGSFTGSLQLGPKTYKVRGAFPPPTADAATTTQQITIPGTTIVLELTLDLKGGSERITGTVSSTGETLVIALDRSVFDAKKRPASSFMGSYTLAIPRNAGQELEPQGNGFGTVKVSAAGAVRFAGLLGDGTAVTQGAVVSKTGGWSFYQSLYKKRGIIAGDLKFQRSDTPNDAQGVTGSDLDGMLDWVRPQSILAGTSYPAGFAAKIIVRGSAYTKAQPIAYSAGTLQLGDGNLGIIPAVLIDIDPLTGKIQPQAGGKFTLRITGGTGLFKGSFSDPQTVKPRTFRGALFQTTHQGFGQFLGAERSDGWTPTGYVELHAN